MSGIQVKGKDRFQQLSGPLSLALFVLLRGSDSTLLKWLQLRGASIAMDEGIEVISFCNVFFFSTLVSGVGLVLLDRRTSCERLKVLTVQEKQLLAWQTVLGFFLAPVAYYLALESLSVVQQTLVFSLTVPASALLASWSLGERLPRTFPLSVGLIMVGLLVAAAAGGSAMFEGGGLSLSGVVWALVGVVAFAFSGLSARRIQQHGLPPGLSVGLCSLVASIAFAVIALALYGPSHFMDLSRWWVLGVIGGYACLITLGSQWTLARAYGSLGVVTVTFWATLTLVVSLIAAHWVLAEPLGWPQGLAAALIMIAVLIQQVSGRRRIGAG